MGILTNNRFLKIYGFICRIDETFQEIILVIVAMVASIKFAYVCANLIGSYNYFVGKIIHNKQIEKNIRIAGIVENIDGIIKQFHVNTIKRLLEEYLLVFKGKNFVKYVNQNTDIIGIDNFNKVVNEEKGFIYSTAHFGSIYLALYKFNEHFSLLKKSIPVNIVRLKNIGFLDRWVEKKFSHQNINLKFRYANNNSIGIQIFKSILKKEAVVLLSDVEYFRRKTKVVKIPFLNISAKFSLGTASLALKTGATILPVYMSRDLNNKYKIVINEPIYPANMDDTTLTELIVKDLEKEILRNPGQWYKWDRIDWFVNGVNYE